MAQYILADEKDLIALPDELTYKDGAQVACGFGTVYEAIEKVGVSGNDAVLVTGLGPVGLATLMLAKALGAICSSAWRRIRTVLNWRRRWDWLIMYLHRMRLMIRS